MLPDSEWNQAITRCRGSIVYLVLLGAFMLVGQSKTIAAAWTPALLYASFSYVWVFAVGFDALVPKIRKVLALILDNLIFGFGFYVGEAGFVLVFWAPIFAAIGYGLRFGIRYGIFSLLFGGILISLAVMISPYWQAQPLIAIGVIMSFYGVAPLRCSFGKTH